MESTKNFLQFLLHFKTQRKYILFSNRVAVRCNTLDNNKNTFVNREHRYLKLQTR